MLKIGLTGGVGSGKTAVSQFFSELKAPVIDTDKITRSLVLIGKPAYQAIIQKFGVSFLRKTGKINREKLRKRIFAHKKEREWLEHLLHPLIQIETISQIKKLQAPYCIIVIPLLVETYSKYLIKNFIDRILVVDTPTPVQIKRVMIRDKIKEQEARAMLCAQASRKERLQWADDIIVNKEDLEQLRKKVSTLHQKYLTLASK